MGEVVFLAWLAYPSLLSKRSNLLRLRPGINAIPLYKSRVFKRALQDLDLSTAEFQGADLRGASYSQRTVWPPGFDVEEAGMYLAPGESSP